MITLAAITAACYGFFPPRDAPDSGPDPCEGVTCSGHGSCSVDQGNALCICDSGYYSVGTACLPDGADGDADADLEPCDLNYGWGSACDSTVCADGSLCSSMFPDSPLAMCFPACSDDTDCSDVSAALEICGASRDGETFCFIICELDQECPCGMLCLPVEGADYDVCAPW